MPKIKIEPTTLIDDLNENNLNSYIQSALDQNVTGIHFDIIDGKYAPNKTMTLKQVLAARKNFPSTSFSVHIMCLNPKKYIKKYLKAKPQIIFFQVDALKNLSEAEKLIKLSTSETQIGLAIDLKTNLTENLLDVINKSTVVIIMPIYAGKSGQKMDEPSLEKIKIIKNHCKNIKQIYVDGGINAQNANKVISAGATAICLGSYLYKLITENKASNFVDSINQ